MSFHLNAEISCDQDDLQRELQRHLGITYNDAETIMCNMGFFQGNGDVVVSLDHPNDLECEGESLVRTWLDDNGYNSIRFYEDH